MFGLKLGPIHLHAHVHDAWQYRQCQFQYGAAEACTLLTVN